MNDSGAGLSGASVAALRHPGLRWRTLFVCALVVAGCSWGGSGLVRALLPAAQAWIGWLEPAFAVRHLRVVDGPQGERVELQVSLARPVRVGEMMVMPHPRGRAQAQVPLAQGLQGPLLLALIVVVWPARHAAEAALRALLAVPATGLLMALDSPVVLLSEIWQLLRVAHAADDWNPIVSWAGLLVQGGRYGLAFMVAALVLWSGAVLCAPSRKQRRRRVY